MHIRPDLGSRHLFSSEDAIMWENLDSLSWGDHLYAFGTAENMPKLLRELLLKSKVRRNKAYDNLADAICPQGTCFTASLHAVPFLLELIENDNIPGRHDAIDILLGVAVACDSDYVPPRECIRESLAEMEEEIACMDTKEREESGALLCLQCYAAVRKGVRTFIRLLDDPDDRVANHAAYALAWFPDDHKLSLPRLRERLVDPKSKRRLSNLILSTGLLEYNAGSLRTLKSKIKPYLSHSDELLKYAAAIYLLWHDPTDEVLELIEQLSEDEGFNKMHEKTPFYGGNLCQYASEVYDEYEE